MLAYLDSVDGLIPVKVLSVSPHGNANVNVLTTDDATVRVKITGKSSIYARGEVLDTLPYRVWARSHVHKCRGKFGRVIVRPHDLRELFNGAA